MAKEPLGFFKIPADYFELPDDQQMAVVEAIVEDLQRATTDASVDNRRSTD